ncbi:hypothetical protein U1Q18_047264 [Sarracenia purpurea var. burkii]
MREAVQICWPNLSSACRSKVFISRQQVLVVSSSKSGSFGGGVSHRVCAVASRHYLLRFWSLCWFGLIAVLVSFAATLVALLFAMLEFLIGFVKQLLVLFQKLFSCLYYSSSSSRFVAAFIFCFAEALLGCVVVDAPLQGASTTLVSSSKQMDN